MVTLLMAAALAAAGDVQEFCYAPDRGASQNTFVASAGVEDSIAVLKQLTALDAQDKTARIRELIGKAEEESRKGNGAAAERYLAEAWALRAEVLHEQGKRSEAESAYSEARRHGWTGAAPWSGSGAQPVQPKPVPVQPKDQEKPRPQPQPVPKPKPKRTRYGEIDTWPFYEMNPLKTSRNAGFNSLLGIPALEEALGIPAETWDARLWIEVQSTDWSDDDGGPNLYKADFHEEAFEFNYGITDQIMAGIRLTIGELMQNGSDPIRIFEGGAQIVPTGDRGFTFGEIVLRGKYVMEASFANLGVLAEIKIPMAGDEDLLTSNTIDLAFMGLITKRFSEKFVIHLNAGIVLPVGSADLFEPEEDPNAFIAFGAAGVLKLSERLVALVQLEGNTAPWADISVLDEFSLRVVGGGRFKLTDTIYLQGGAGFGISELSGGLMFTGSINLTF